MKPLKKTLINDLLTLIDGNGRTALHYAAMCSRDSQVIYTLINIGADPYKVDKFGYSPATLAIEHSMSPEVIEIFRNHSPRVSQQVPGAIPLVKILSRRYEEERAKLRENIHSAQPIMDEILRFLASTL